MPPRHAPACDCREQSLPIGSRQRIVLSVGQFRPEKDHKKQLLAFAAVKAKGTHVMGLALEVANALVLRHSSSHRCTPSLLPAALPLYNEVKLVIVGGARGEDDMERVRELKTMAIDLGVEV